MARYDSQVRNRRATPESRFVDEFSELRAFFNRRRLLLTKATAVCVDELIERIGETVLESDDMRQDESRGITNGLGEGNVLWAGFATRSPRFVSRSRMTTASRWA